MKTIAFIHELWVRFTLKSPAFAAKVQWIAGILIVLIPAVVAAAQEAGWGWDLIIVNLILIKVTLVQFLGGVVVFLSGVFVQAKTAIEDRAKLARKIKDRAPSASRFVPQR